MTDPSRLYLLGLGAAVLLALLGAATLLAGRRGRSAYAQAPFVLAGKGMLLAGAGLSITSAFVFFASVL